MFFHELAGHVSIGLSDITFLHIKTLRTVKTALCIHIKIQLLLMRYRLV